MRQRFDTSSPVEFKCANYLLILPVRPGRFVDGRSINNNSILIENIVRHVLTERITTVLFPKPDDVSPAATLLMVLIAA